MHINSPIRTNWGNTISKITIPRERRGFILVTFTDVSYSYNFMPTTSLWDDLFMLPHTLVAISAEFLPLYRRLSATEYPRALIERFQIWCKILPTRQYFPRYFLKLRIDRCSMWFPHCPTECALNHANFPLPVLHAVTLSSLDHNGLYAFCNPTATDKTKPPLQAIYIKTKPFSRNPLKYCNRNFQTTIYNLRA